jgi:RNA recognition motif-containing protein
MKLYVGNIPYSLDDSSLGALFSPFGTVETAKVVADRASGRSKGFGFVEMPDEAARKAVETLNGSEQGGRTIHVSEARPKPDGGR